MQKLLSRNHLVNLEATRIFSDPQGNNEEVETHVCNLKRKINLAEREPRQELGPASQLCALGQIFTLSINFLIIEWG